MSTRRSAYKLVLFKGSMATNKLQNLKKRKRPAPPTNPEEENYNDGKHCVPICVVSALTDFTQIVYVCNLM